MSFSEQDLTKLTQRTLDIYNSRNAKGFSRLRFSAFLHHRRFHQPMSPTSSSSQLVKKLSHALRVGRHPSRRPADWPLHVDQSGNIGNRKNHLFSLSFFYNGIANMANLVSLFTSKESPIDVIRNASSFGWEPYRIDYQASFSFRRLPRSERARCGW